MKLLEELETLRAAALRNTGRPLVVDFEDVKYKRDGDEANGVAGEGDDAVKSGFLQLCEYLPGELSLTHAEEGPQIFQLLAQQMVVHEQQHAQLPGNR